MFHSKRFQFFQSKLITANEEGNTEEPHPLFKQLSITCSTSGHGFLIFGDDQGFVNLVQRDFTAKAFQAHKSTIQLIQHLKERPILISLGSDDEKIPHIIKLWDMEKEERSGDPICLKTIILNPKVHTNIMPVTCMSARENLSEMAIGFCDGTVLLIYNDVTGNAKQKVIRSPDEIPVTVLGWKEGGRNSALFAVTTNSVSVFPVGSFQEEEIDSHGCALECGLTNDECDLLVGRTEAIYFYTPEGRGPCLAFDGEKKKLAWFRNNLIVVGISQNWNSINIYDMKNKFTAFTGNFQNVTHVLTEWGLIFVLTRGGKAYQLTETDTQTKLETLYMKHNYQLAINLASSQQYDYNSIVDIYRKYGDHLYGKGDYDAAVSQYVKTIGGLEPSYVIRKFLDAQQIHNLTSYLQALHEQNRANADHTTLLLNCYTKLKDVGKLDEFIKTDSGYKFDLETAIKVCRQAGYYDHALLLARTHGRHEWYLKILLEDSKDYERAIDYISTLEFKEAEKNMKQYGKAMMNALPERTTEFLKSLCTFYVPKISSEFGEKSTNVVSSSILADLDQMLAAESAENIKARPEEFIHIFMNNEEWLVQLLEYVIEKDESKHHVAVYDTLLELYLQDDDLLDIDAELKKQKMAERHEKAKKLLADERAEFDDHHALALCRQYNFKTGILYLYKRQQMFNEIIEYHMENNEYKELIQACKKYGNADPNLWVQTLSYFSMKPGDQCHAEIALVLDHIDKDNLMPPLLVLQILKQKKSATLGAIKKYIVRRLMEDHEQISSVQQQIRDNTKNTEEMKKQITKLRTTACIFKLNKCTHCNQPLDLPAIHFLCMHSYHARCMTDENVCDACVEENRQVLEIKRSLEANVGKHDQFFKQLKESPDGFSTAAEYFGRGIFNKPVKDA